MPRFLVLLLALDRFEIEDWGFNPLLDTNAERDRTEIQVNRNPSTDSVPRRSTTITLDALSMDTAATPSSEKSIEKLELKLQLDDPRKHVRYILLGRDTRVYPAEQTGRNSPSDIVVKISWIQETRDSEVDILKRAWAVAKTDESVRGHLPQVLGHRDFPECATGRLRQSLQEDTPRDWQTVKVPRILRAIAFRSLRPITTLTGEKFMKAFFDCFECNSKPLRVSLLLKYLF